LGGQGGGESESEGGGGAHEVDDTLRAVA
jgi:hypothetical protein